MAGLDKNHIPEGVEVDAQGVISCTRDALNRLGDWCRKNAGALAVSVFAATATNAVLAQSLPSNPEYDRIIAEAQKQGRDPLEIAQEKKKNGEWNIGRYIEFSKYNRNLQEQAAMADEARTGKKQEAAITRANNEKRIDEQLIKQTQVILTAMKSMESQGRFGPKQIEDVNRMYEQSILDEEKRLIREAFGKYLKTDKVAGL